MTRTDWVEELYRLDIADPDSKGCTITLGEYLRVDCPELEQFIKDLLTELEEYGEGMRVGNFPTMNEDIINERIYTNQAIDQYQSKIRSMKGEK